VGTSSLQMGMMTAVRASGFIAWSRTDVAVSAWLSPRSVTQKPISAVTKPVTTQAESTTNSVSWPYCSQALPLSGCACANRKPASAVVSTVISMKTARRRLAACSQGSAGAA
jgi:hypothetical protein